VLVPLYNPLCWQNTFSITSEFILFGTIDEEPFFSFSVHISSKPIRKEQISARVWWEIWCFSLSLILESEMIDCSQSWNHFNTFLFLKSRSSLISLMGRRSRKCSTKMLVFSNNSTVLFKSSLHTLVACFN